MVCSSWTFLGVLLFFSNCMIPMASTSFSGVKIITHEEASASESSAYVASSTWIMTVASGCTDIELERMQKQLANKSKIMSTGHPSNGGLCTISMSCSFSELTRLLGANEWLAQTFVEADAELSVPDDVEEVDVGDSMSPQGEPSSVASQQSNPPSWGLDRIDDRTFLDNSYQTPGNERGEGVHVYVLDTGVRTTHQDFGGRAIPSFESLGSGVVVCSPTNPDCAFDRNGHGTHCAGTVAGDSFGVAKAATIHAGKVLTDTGRGRMSWLISALDWVLTNGQRPAVISLSLGGRGSFASVTTAINNAVNGGVTVVVAAGNEADDACNYSPAGVAAAITVGATQRPADAHSDPKPGYSNTGPCVDLFAPGSSITSAWFSSDTATRTISGTSMACPHVAGAAALLLGADLHSSPNTVLTTLLAAATRDIVSNIDETSPNKLLFVGEVAPTPAPPPTPSPTPVPIPGGTWLVTEGECVIDYSTMCAQTKNHPMNYENNQRCVINIGENLGQLNFVQFETEQGYDFLNFNNVQYSGSDLSFSPGSGVVATQPIIWESDYSVVRSGWKVCQEMAATPLPTPTPTPLPTPTPQESTPTTSITATSLTSVTTTATLPTTSSTSKSVITTSSVFTRITTTATFSIVTTTTSLTTTVVTRTQVMTTTTLRVPTPSATPTSTIAPHSTETRTTTTLTKGFELWPVECGPACRCEYWSRSARLRFRTIEECQNHAEESGHVFFTYNPNNRKCVSGNGCFYNTRTGHPSTRWYENSLQWRAHKSPHRQILSIRISSLEIITPDPDFEDEEAEVISTEQIELELVLSVALRYCPRSVCAACATLCLIFFLWTCNP